MVIHGPTKETGGITAFTLDPSGSLASTIGLLHLYAFNRRYYPFDYVHNMTFITEPDCRLSILPPRSTYTFSGPLTIISVTFHPQERLMGPNPHYIINDFIIILVFSDRISRRGSSLRTQETPSQPLSASLSLSSGDETRSKSSASISLYKP